ncbi:redox-regulated ATPase YchF [Coxiella endosymbiont of Amblyomma nuttalli]|uniref:redox-regulated ATPase YchF n=1 Tax=Coxiella endosymbiont of Amblyomma nuttalli TaxID=2749996 RepID=UPI001BAE0C30|nr:redox-regulated ATPase YchF [Coxiella endosymbiont of Amblyomma nuttalli]QTS84241.1 Ribosome-binding ATPase YchF [Coxiella endosymbiont of Amblyomma nuttalli]
MGFKCGIVGLPNVGKSTLFNALTKAGIKALNYPFCTIEPNVGVVLVPDKRLEKIAQLIQPKRIIPATVQFVDIAGLVAGASKGQGLGNQFLAHIRETQAIAHVVRCFENENIIHVSKNINPFSDIEIVHTELALSDIETIDKVLMKITNYAKQENKKAREVQILFEKFKNFLNQGVPLRRVKLKEDEKISLQPYQLLTLKPVLYIANVTEGEFVNNPYLDQVLKYAAKDNAKVITICASIEAEIAELSPIEQIEFLQSLNFKESGLNRIIQAGYELMGFITFFTAGPQEVRAWTCLKGTTASQAAGVIHSDFEKRFIRAEVIGYNDYLQFNGEQGAKNAGRWHLEGKEYVVQDGDIIYFRSGTA